MYLVYKQYAVFYVTLRVPALLTLPCDLIQIDASVKHVADSVFFSLSLIINKAGFKCLSVFFFFFQEGSNSEVERYRVRPCKRT